MRFKLFILFLLFLICPGINLYAQSDTLSYSVKDNTISPNLKFTKDDEVLVNKYKHVAGIKISKYYEVLDSVFINPIAGSSKYCVLVLSTLAQDGAAENDHPNLPEGKRLLVVLKYIKGSYVIDYVNENAILNVDYSQSEPFLGIKRDSAGFTLKYFIGSVNKCTFFFYFKLEDNNFYLSNYITDCYKIDLSERKKKEHPYKDKSERRNLRNIRIEGYLQVL